MPPKISTIKNPLTVIAIFAGITEVSGSAVLPFINEVNQQIYIWFLMLFPCLLVTLFFIVLNWNHRVLYAPSDFNNEDNFVNILKKSTILEEASDYEKNYSAANLGIKVSGASNIIENIADINDTNSLPVMTNKEERARRSKLIKAAFKQSKDENKSAEKFIIKRLESELGTKIDAGMKFEFGRNQFLFGGVARSGNNRTVIDINFWENLNTLSEYIIYRKFESLEQVYRSLNDDQKSNFSLIFIVVTDHSCERTIETINKLAKELSFPFAFKLYDFDKLASEMCEKAS